MGINNMANIFNLSYDISTEMAEKNRVNQEDILTREAFMKILIEKGVIITTSCFSIHGYGRVIAQHIVLNPVKTTIIFKSEMKREQIVALLSRFSKQMHYVITEVKEDEKLYLGSLNDNEELQQSCDEIVQNIIDNQYN